MTNKSCTSTRPQAGGLCSHRKCCFEDKEIAPTTTHVQNEMVWQRRGRSPSHVNVLDCTPETDTKVHFIVGAFCHDLKYILKCKENSNPSGQHAHTHVRWAQRNTVQYYRPSLCEEPTKVTLFLFFSTFHFPFGIFYLLLLFI